MKIFIVFLIMIANCKAHVKEAEVTKPEALKSESGSLLVVMRSSDSSQNERNYCVVWKSQKDGNISSKLLTASGGISEGQLKKSLRWIPNRSEILLLSVLAAGSGGATTGVGGAIAGGVIVVVTGAIVVVDSINSRSKVKLLVDEEVAEVSNSTMERAIQRISNEKSKKPGTCDHILLSLSEDNN